MGSRGPARKDPESRRRRNVEPPPTILTQPKVTDELRGPDLPQGQDWPDATRRWWWTWRRCAQAATFTPTDWDFLLDTAILHAALWNGDTRVSAELRFRVAKFGATPEDRLRLRMQVTTLPDPATEGEGNGQQSRYAHLRAVKSG